MEPQTRLIHWYDTEQRRIACGAAGMSNSTKHQRGVTCVACLARITDDRGSAKAAEAASSWVH